MLVFQLLGLGPAFNVFRLLLLPAVGIHLEQFFGFMILISLCFNFAWIIIEKAMVITHLLHLRVEQVALVFDQPVSEGLLFLRVHELLFLLFAVGERAVVSCMT